ncbi:hypothetical protein VDG04_08455 [Xanthomonas campestris pv. raphani]|uniref:hypothetical protein n=1 Tax=Xanthomonas campestris TaxID=339 RepID=UPI002B2230A1|nr:hypothetical protein [Xanthomonas campestris]MEA9896620.1 hypothetical protein [Xanthomonas campestris pv. raphani]
MLSQEASAVVASFGQQPGVTREHLDNFNRVLNDSPELTRQINEAVQLLSSAHASRRPCPRSDQMAEQVRSRPRFPVAALVVAMGLIASCASSTSASTAPSFSGQWAYAKKCDLGHYLSLHLQQHGDRVTGDWSAATNAHGNDGQLQGQVRGDTLYVRYCSDDGGNSYAACPAFSGPEDQFRLENGQLVHYQKYGSVYRRSVALHSDIAGKEVPFDKNCKDPEDDQ